MNLSGDRFFQGDCMFRGSDGITRKADVYSYETHNALYDVVIFEERPKAKYVRKNCGSLANRIDAWSPIHYAIERHFDL